MRALITGDRGFLGRHFRFELETRGYYVDGYDTRDGQGGDCRTLFTSRWSPPRYDLVIHCAAVVGGREKIERDPLATAVNLELDASYLAWVARTRPGHVVYVSSSAVYPVDLQTRQTALGTGLQPTVANGHRLVETDQRACADRLGAPDEVYGWTKLVGERLCHSVVAADVPVTIVRPFSGYGHDQDLNYPFPSFIRRAVSREDPFTVWGDGQQVRDLIHVGDVVRGTLAVVEHDAARWVAADADYVLRPVNLCTGRPTSFDQLAEIVCQSVGYAPSIEHVGSAPTGVRYRVGDPTRFNSHYTCRVTIEEGVWRALDLARRLG